MERVGQAVGADVPLLGQPRFERLAVRCDADELVVDQQHRPDAHVVRRNDRIEVLHIRIGQAHRDRPACLGRRSLRGGGADETVERCGESAEGDPGAAERADLEQVAAGDPPGCPLSGFEFLTRFCHRYLLLLAGGSIDAIPSRVAENVWIGANRGMVAEDGPADKRAATGPGRPRGGRLDVASDRRRPADPDGGIGGLGRWRIRPNQSGGLESPRNGAVLP